MLCRNFNIALSITLAVLLAFSATAKADNYRQIEWIELMPAEDLEALLSPPESIGNIADGSDQDSVEGLSGAEDEATQRYLKALESTDVIRSFDNTSIRLPGFVVPLEMTDEYTAVEFLVVPYFGACLHLPPPPPNQIVYVKYPKGVKLSSFQDAFWLEGTLKIESTESEQGTAAYTLEVDSIEPYSE
ncbi:DUF3299 domain-containing protein [Echinimonas agarilytica]|uniref:DUF3299 domain-containing protein n=1 Tax=Echinimonas agarilytica TaxID=1215918 RepID=A0AA41W8F4_9GAMM|nr:DUF3299 domain-containing protein [Echinimonas agarilytica]MCM2680358.1 DUF3299 domain-containing protein [Echinimonas agarilytica]